MEPALSMTTTTRTTVNGFERVVADIRERLVSGALRKGDVLPSEREFSQQLGVSRPTLREALRSLSILGVVEIRHGAGTVISAPDVGVLGDFLSFALAQDGGSFDEILEARIAIECQAVRLATLRAGPADFERLRAHADAIAETINTPVEGARADYHFHMAMVQASGASALRTMYVAVADLLQRSHLSRRLRTSADDATRNRIVEDHYLILQAISEGDPDAAERKVREHFEIGRRFRREESVRRT